MRLLFQRSKAGRKALWSLPVRLGLLLFLCGCGAGIGKSPGRDAPVVAVLDLEAGSAISDDEAGHYTDVLRAALLSTGEVVLVDRGRMSRQARLRELVRQQSGLSEGLAEIGRELDAGVIMHGSVRRKGRRFLVTIKAVDVETARVRTQQVSTARSEYLLEDEILKMTPRLVAKLVDKSPDDISLADERYRKLQDRERSRRLKELAAAAVGAPLRFAERNKYVINRFAPGFKHFQAGNYLTGLFFMSAFAGTVNTAGISYTRVRRAQNDYNDLTRLGLLVLATTPAFETGEARSADERNSFRGKLRSEFLFNYLLYASQVNAKREEALANGRTFNLSLGLAAFIWIWGQARDEDDAFFAGRVGTPGVVLEIATVYDSPLPDARPSEEMTLGYRIWF